MLYCALASPCSASGRICSSVTLFCCSAAASCAKTLPAASNNAATSSMCQYRNLFMVLLVYPAVLIDCFTCTIQASATTALAGHGCHPNNGTGRRCGGTG